MQKNLITTIVIFIFTVVMGLWWTYFAGSILISDYSWAIPAALIGGGVAGVVRGIRKDTNQENEHDDGPAYGRLISGALGYRNRNIPDDGIGI